MEDQDSSIASPIRKLVPLPTVYLAIFIVLPLVLLYLVGGGLGWIWLIFLSVGASAGIADLFLAMNGRAPIVRRIPPSVWPVYVSGIYRVQIKNCLRRALAVEYAEDSSSDLTKDLPEGKLFLGAGEEKHFQVEFEARVRGDLPLGPAYLRYLSPLRLWIVSVVENFGESLRIYPNIKDYVAFDPFQHRRRLFQMGEKRIRMQGEGTDFDSLREYLPGDDYKKLNWKATARLNRPVISVFRAEQNKEILILLDCGRQMFVEIAGRPRFEHYLDAAVRLSYAASLERDRVGLVAFANDILHYIPPRRKSEVLYDIYKLQPARVETDYLQLVTYLSGIHPRRSLVLLMTEITDSISGGNAMLAVGELAKHHQVTVVILDDPKIHALSNSVPQDEDAFLDHISALEYLRTKHLLTRELARTGVDVVRTYGEELSLELVNHYLRYKALNRL